MKYFQRVQPHEQYFRYEYWWVTAKEIYGPRLMKVRIPPTGGPAGHLPWEFWEIDGNPDGNLMYDKDKDEYIWLDFIQQPDSSLFDCRTKK